jgi:hypothetical protein
VATAVGTAVERLQATAHIIPTDRPESDGTLEWDSTTTVVVEAHDANGADTHKDALAAAHGIDLSAHCAPAASLAACTAVPRFPHLEWFHDHVWVEAQLFDGVPEPEGGVLRPNLSHPGNGLSLR